MKIAAISMTMNDHFRLSGISLFVLCMTYSLCYIHNKMDINFNTIIK